MKEHYIVLISDYYNDIFVWVEQKFNTYEEAVDYILEHYEDLEQMNKWSWNDGHDLYQVIPYTDK